MTLTSPSLTKLKLGLIGDNISRSRSPRLHRLAGEMAGNELTYDRLVPTDLGQSFEGVFQSARKAGYRGLNITYPYKERVIALVEIVDPVLRAIGAVNTVLFEPGGPQGHNTDFTGFKAAYQHVRGVAAPGEVLLIGTGGVGRAIAFGLADLGIAALRLVDRDRAKAEALAADLAKMFPDLAVKLSATAEEAALGVQGLVNATPVGMVGYEGTPLARLAMAKAEWAFDAVYTPKDTLFLQDAEAAGLDIVSGWELFFYQGVHAWKLFSGSDASQDDLRSKLLSEEHDT
ncbi:shikimate dehydrogenase family protein [Nioella aestuarii]|uniref:shikimate dehydrogenase family protein n=1 Tax=Nioella aestuarii TaxID=1662864 RepID=UPI003D7F7F59